MPWKEYAYKKCINRELRRTAHKRRQKNRHLTVTLAGQRSRCHYRRNCTTKANQHRHYAASGKPNLSQQLVHDKGNPCNIAAVLHHGEEKEQRYNNWQKAQHASNACKNTVDYQTAQSVIDICTNQDICNNL